jgi:hypothetical protein
MIAIGSSRYGVFAGVVTTATGSALVLAPGRLGPMMGLTEPAVTRAIGIADLALVPGLIVGRPQVRAKHPSLSCWAGPRPSGHRPWSGWASADR